MSKVILPTIVTTKNGQITQITDAKNNNYTFEYISTAA